MPREHDYSVAVSWTGNRGSGTSGYREFDRDHTIAAAGPPEILGSADPAFRGDATRWNPEQLLVAALSECHMLWYLHLCADAGVVVTRYVDEARGTMAESRDGGHFTNVTLAPTVTVRDADTIETARELHETAHKMCFIANSVNFPVGHEATITTESA